MIICNHFGNVFSCASSSTLYTLHSVSRQSFKLASKLKLPDLRACSFWLEYKTGPHGIQHNTNSNIIILSSPYHIPVWLVCKNAVPSVRHCQEKTLRSPKADTHLPFRNIHETKKEERRNTRMMNIDESYTWGRQPGCQSLSKALRSPEKEIKKDLDGFDEWLRIEGKLFLFFNQNQTIFLY